MIYFKSKYLSEKLNYNLAKWKRWSREFLDPDPLGGYQSGYARQFSFKDAFRVFLGGHLVGRLNFTIPQARQILVDLHPWLKENQVYSWPRTANLPSDNLRRCIFIYDTNEGNGYAYAVRRVTPQTTPKSDGFFQEIYALELIGVTLERIMLGEFTHARVIDVDALHRYFLDRVDRN